MKKNILVLILSMIFVNESFACGGCVDSSLGSSMASNGISSYDRGEESIFQSIDELNSLLENEILKTEKEVLKENKRLLSLEQNINIQQKMKIFF